MTFQLLVIRSSTLTRLERDEFNNITLCIGTKRVYQRGTSKFLKEEIFSCNNSETKELYTKKSKDVNNNAQRGLARNRNSVQMRKREKGKDANNNRQTATLSLHQRLLDWTRKGKAR